MVGPDGDPNRNALATAKSGGYGVSRIVDLDDEKVEEIEKPIDDLATKPVGGAEFGE